MEVPTTWQAFRTRYIDKPRHGDYKSALAEVSAGWVETKLLRDAVPQDPAWRTVAATQMQARIDADIASRAALVAAAGGTGVAPGGPTVDPGETDGTTTLLAGGGGEDLDPTPRPTESADSLWRGGWKLGGRDPNTANIWLRLNAHNIVVDRRVVKDTQVMPHAWVDFTRWSGPDPRDLQNREHVDYTIQRRLCDIPLGGENFARVRGYRNMPENRMYRVVQDYCDGGDMAELRRIHMAGISEPLVWRILEQLAKSAIVMEQGSLVAPVPGWQQIVHYDLKPANVFLVASSTPGAIYPDAKLGDFELALQTSATDQFNPATYRDVGSGDMGWVPPEVRPRDSRAMCMKVASRPDLPNLDNEQFLAPANIWGIGVCIFDLMNGRTIMRCYDDSGDPAGTGFVAVNDSDFVMKRLDPMFEGWTPAALGTYSSHLVQAVRSCLRDHPNDRITPTALLALINEPIPHPDGADDATLADISKAENAKAARDGTNVGPEWGPFIDHEDNYKMDLSFWTIVNAVAASESSGSS